MIRYFRKNRKKILLVVAFSILLLFNILKYVVGGYWFLPTSIIEKISRENTAYPPKFAWDNFRTIRIGDSKERLDSLGPPFRTFSWLNNQQCNEYSKSKYLAEGYNTLLGAPPFSWAKYWVQVVICTDTNNKVVSKWENYWDY